MSFWPWNWSRETTHVTCRWIQRTSTTSGFFTALGPLAVKRLSPSEGLDRFRSFSLWPLFWRCRCAGNQCRTIWRLCPATVSRHATSSAKHDAIRPQNYSAKWLIAKRFEWHSPEVIDNVLVDVGSKLHKLLQRLPVGIVRQTSHGRVLLEYVNGRRSPAHYQAVEILFDSVANVTLEIFKRGRPIERSVTYMEKRNEKEVHKKTILT